MPVDWHMLQKKKRSLNQPPISPSEAQRLEDTVAKLLEIPASDCQHKWGFSPGYGFRTRALVAVHAGVPHKYHQHYPQVIVKLFRGPATDFIHFHGECFRKLDAIAANDSFQQSLDAGLTDDKQAYAVLQYVPGDTLRLLLASSPRWSVSQVVLLVSRLLDSIWIPAWASGLRFKDCHAGNFVAGASAELVMIDVEQMRKSVFEMLRCRSDWTDRDRHEASAFKRIPKLVADLLGAADYPYQAAALKRLVKQCLDESGLIQQLSALGRETNDTRAAVAASERFVDQLRQHARR